MVVVARHSSSSTRRKPTNERLSEPGTIDQMFLIVISILLLKPIQINADAPYFPTHLYRLPSYIFPDSRKSITIEKTFGKLLVSHSPLLLF